MGATRARVHGVARNRRRATRSRSSELKKLKNAERPWRKNNCQQPPRGQPLSRFSYVAMPRMSHDVPPKQCAVASNAARRLRYNG